MPEKSTLPYRLPAEERTKGTVPLGSVESVEKVPKEAKSRPERYWGRRFALAGVIGAVALAGASGSSEKTVSKGLSLEGVEAPVAMMAEASPASFEDSGFVSTQAQLEELINTGQIRISKGLSFGKVGGALLERSYADRPDEVAGPQVHPIYIVPADGFDRQLDTNGALEIALWNSQDWLAGTGRGDGLSLRMDTYQEQMDISFYRSSKTDAELQARGIYIINSLKDELWAKGFSDNPDEVLLAFYDGSPGACDVANWPPLVPGNTALINVSARCGPLSTERGFFTGNDTAIPHESFHATGQVPVSAPNSDGRGHTNEPNDLMRAGVEIRNEGRSVVIDRGHDDYWNNIVPWLTSNHYPVDIDIVGQGEVQSDIKPNKYLGIGESYTFADGAMWFRTNDAVSLDATPADETWKFAGWGGDGTGVDKREVIVSGEQAVTATFEPIVNIDLRVRGAGIVKVTGEKACRSSGLKVVLCHYEEKPGTKVQLDAVAAQKNRFVKWQETKSTKPSLKFTARWKQDKELTAVFGKTITKRRAKAKTK